MHIFLSVLAALVVAYALRHWWESRHERRADRAMRRALRKFEKHQRPPRQSLKADDVFVSVLILIGIFGVTIAALARMAPY